MRYLGLDFEDLSAAEDIYAKYQASLICPEQGTFEVSQENGGQGGILVQQDDWLTTDNFQTRKSAFRGYDR